MATARDMIRRSLKLVGVLADGESLSAEQGSDGLEVLNEILDSWSTQKLLILAQTREEFTLTPSTQSYTIGATGTFVTSRPVKIESAKIKDLGSPANELPLSIINSKQWADIINKDTGASTPTHLYIENTMPLATLKLWPKPSAAYSLVLYSSKPLTSVSNLSETLDLAPGYTKALRYTLAIALGKEYGRPIDPEVSNEARMAVADIKRVNITPSFLTVDAALTKKRSFNFNSGE